MANTKNPYRKCTGGLDCGDGTECRKHDAWDEGYDAGREQGRALSEAERAVVEAAMRRYLDDPDSLDNSLRLLGACKALAAERAKEKSE